MVEANDSVVGGFEDLAELAGGGVAKELGAFAVGDVAGEDDDAVFVRASGDFEPDVERLRVVGLELSGDAPLHGGAVVGEKGLLPVGRETVPEVFADERVGFEDGERGAVGEGAVPLAIDADDGVGEYVEDLLKLTDGGVAERFGALAVGDVTIVESDTFVGGDDVDVDPDVEGRVEVLDVLGNASLHDVAVGAFEVGADGFGEELPVGLGVDVGGLEAADADGFGVCVGDGPVGVAAEDGFG